MRLLCQRSRPVPCTSRAQEPGTSTVARPQTGRMPRPCGDAPAYGPPAGNGLRVYDWAIPDKPCSDRQSNRSSPRQHMSPRLSNGNTSGRSLYLPRQPCRHPGWSSRRRLRASGCMATPKAAMMDAATLNPRGGRPHRISGIQPCGPVWQMAGASRLGTLLADMAECQCRQCTTGRWRNALA